MSVIKVRQWLNDILVNIPVTGKVDTELTKMGN